MAIEKLNDEVLDTVTGASNAEVQELIAAIQANENLKYQWDYTYGSNYPVSITDSERVYAILHDCFHMDEDETVINPGDASNVYIDQDGHRYYHYEILKKIQEY